LQFADPLLHDPHSPMTNRVKLGHCADRNAPPSNRQIDSANSRYAIEW
jgi:hypothetical protein